MKARYIASGATVNFTPTAAVGAGDVVVIGTSLIGVAAVDIPANTLGAIALSGMYHVAKATGEVKAGDALYWDTSKKTVSKTAAGGKYIGVAVADAASSDAEVALILNMGTAPAAVPASQAMP